MGDQLRFVDDSGDTRLAGELVDDGATVGDVLTVQSDGSLAAAPGGGSSPSGSLVSARVASTGNLSLSGIPDPSLTDGVTVADGDRVLVWMQSTPAENGVYVAAAGAWALSADYADMQVGDTIGTVYDGDTWYASLFIRDSDTTFAALCQAGTPYFSRTGFYTLGGFKLKAVGLPTADPHAVNQLWANSGVVTVSAG